MKAIILAGGFGSRISEESVLRPKPMIEIGGKPILWHIMKCYARHGITDFVICCGYKGYMIKEYFANYFLHTSDVTFDLAANAMQVHRRTGEAWKVTLVDTGEQTMTGGRLKRVLQHIDGTFCFTYGDGVSDIDIGALIAFHRQHGRLCTLTTVQPPGRYGAVALSGDAVLNFQEKPQGDGSWINGGFFVCEPEVCSRIKDDTTSWESISLPALAAEEQLRAFRHGGFWQAMDTMRDRNLLESLWTSGSPPWRSW